MTIERYSDLPVGIRIEAVRGSGGEVHPGVAVEGEAIALHLHVGPVGGDDPHLAVALHLVTLYTKLLTPSLPTWMLPLLTAVVAATQRQERRSTSLAAISVCSTGLGSTRLQDLSSTMGKNCLSSTKIKWINSNS